MDWGCRITHGVWGTILIGVSLFFLIGQVLTSTAGTMPWCSLVVDGGGWTAAHALALGALGLGFTYWLSGCCCWTWGTHAKTNIAQEYRPWRWVGHAFLIAGVLQIFFFAQGLATNVLMAWIAPIIVAMALAYLQSSNESMNAKENAYTLVSGAKRSGWTDVPKCEGWVVATLIVTALIVGLALRGASMSAGALTYSWWFIAWYLVLHFYIAAVVNTKWFTNTGFFNVNVREGLFIAWEFIFLVVVYVVVYLNVDFTACGP